jgi:hypothetical protein
VAVGVLDTLLALILECGMLFAGCAALNADPDRSGKAELNLEGVWNGVTVNDCSPVQVEPSRCRAMQRISFTMLRHNDKSWGSYSCAPGTTPCYDLVDRGSIKYLKLNGRVLWMRVMRDDHSSCLFDTIPAGDKMRGKFWCFQGDEIIERGFWQVERAY